MGTDRNVSCATTNVYAFRKRDDDIQCPLCSHWLPREFTRTDRTICTQPSQRPSQIGRGTHPRSRP